MTKRTAMTLTLSALLLGGSMVGCTAQHGGLAAVSDAAAARATTLAATAAARAKDALGHRKPQVAVAAAEEAVRWQPQDAAYRVLLGQSYLSAGRFIAARDALSDALTLDPANGRAALNLALAQTASGAWDAARATLDAHADVIPAADRGLAVALAGDPATAIQILNDAARQPGADAKTRQNLALALALAGRWTEARAVAAFDLPADQVDRRIEQWAAFAYPRSASDQVASLLGVTPAADPGQPAALALNTAPSPKSADAAPAMAAAAPSAPMVAAAEPAPVATPVQVAQAPAALDAAKVAAEAPAPAAAHGVVFAPRREVVQPLPSLSPRQLAAVRAIPVKQAPVAAADALAKGNFYVQLGAYDNAGVARDGWLRAARRLPALAGRVPQGMTIKAAGGTFYRLSVGGFAREQADAMCRAYRQTGGSCFVRPGAGDQVAQWVQPDKRRQYAMR